MPASTSTVTAAGSENGNGKLRKAKDVEVEEEKVGWEKHERDFYWTYTEEPHRTRRMAIIKAHPEVRLPLFIPPLSPQIPPSHRYPPK